ncbi:MAG: aspartate aminotransferase family protein [Cyclobacteriaceae bacterium]|nr:aspartate aminotransferase family protein [Cyclobacteriaceae bacterium]
MPERLLFKEYLAQTSDFPMMLDIERAEGIYLYNPHGKPYIDLISGIGVSNLGHRHPAVLKAIKEQLDKYLHVMVYGEFVQSPQVRLAEALASTLPESLKVSYLVNSGSEAIEGAMKLAKRHTGRREIISCFNAYHGSTHGALSIGGGEKFKNAYRPLLPEIRQIRFGKLDDLEMISCKTAAVVMETVQGEAGVRTASKSYFKALRKRCDETGALLVLDEIQAGFGRTGSFWAFQQYDIIPDILVSAKGMGGGMPIGAFIASEEIMKGLRNDPILGHITTFGGHPVSAAASLATLQTIVQEKLVEKVAEKEKLFLSRLQHPDILEVRSKGLMIAVQFTSFDKAKSVVDACLRNGLVTDWFLYCDDSVRLAPPLIIEKHEIMQATSLFLQSIDG